MKRPYTDNQFKVLEAAFRGVGVFGIETRRAKTRAINDMVAARLIYSGYGKPELTRAGLVAYVDMCERRDADSGCIAFQHRAAEARAALMAA